MFDHIRTFFTVTAGGHDVMPHAAPIAPIKWMGHQGIPLFGLSYPDTNTNKNTHTNTDTKKTIPNKLHLSTGWATKEGYPTPSFCHFTS